jgi:predicted transcriptional regulator
MITFACKKIQIEDLVRCSFELSKTEYSVLLFLLQEKENYSVIEIAEKMNFERTTVQKAIKLLLEKNLVKRLQNNLDRGGYQYIYEIDDKPVLKNKMKSIVDKWHEKVHGEIDNW